jgi:hypothetical protein
MEKAPAIVCRTAPKSGEAGWATGVCSAGVVVGADMDVKVIGRRPGNRDRRSDVNSEVPDKAVQ